MAKRSRAPVANERLILEFKIVIEFGEQGSSLRLIINPRTIDDLDLRTANLFKPRSLPRMVLSFSTAPDLSTNIGIVVDNCYDARFATRDTPPQDPLVPRQQSTSVMSLPGHHQHRSTVARRFKFSG
jgi:hypothetical protein